MVSITLLLALFAAIFPCWLGSKFLLHLSFQITNVHSNMIMRNSLDAPWHVSPFLDFIFRRGSAMMVDTSRTCGHGIFSFHRSLW